MNETTLTNQIVFQGSKEVFYLKEGDYVEYSREDLPMEWGRITRFYDGEPMIQEMTGIIAKKERGDHLSEANPKTFRRLESLSIEHLKEFVDAIEVYVGLKELTI